MLELVLASASPRRLNLLRALSLKCTVLPQDIDESPLPAEKPTKLVKRLALAKAKSAYATLSETDHRLVLGSDTIVVCDDQILGKPQNKSDGLAMLRLLSGRTHQVLTAVRGTYFVRIVDVFGREGAHCFSVWSPAWRCN